MLISIIIPVYNVANYIQKCLLSALNQTYKNIEIILVDDAGPDNSMEIAKRLLQDHPRKDCVRIITHSQNRGLSAARNSGLEDAKGEYVYFLDSDDYLPENSIALLADPAQSNHPQCVVGNYQCSITPTRYYPQLTLKAGLYTKPTILEAYISRKIYMMAPNKLYERTYLLDKKIFFKEGLLHEDELFSFQFFSLCESLYVVDAITYIYVIRDASITNSITLRNYDHWVIIIREISDWVKQYDNLQQYPELFFYVEDLKNNLLRNLIRQQIPLTNCADYYRQLRKINFNTPTGYLLKSASFRQRKRLIHYLFNPEMGFALHRFIMK